MIILIFDGDACLELPGVFEIEFFYFKFWSGREFAREDYILDRLGVKQQGKLKTIKQFLNIYFHYKKAKILVRYLHICSLSCIALSKTIRIVLTEELKAKS